MVRKSKYNYVYIPPKIQYINNTSFNLFVAKSNIKNAGNGLFTKDYIDKDTCLGIYEGIIVKNNVPLSSEYSLDLENGTYVDALDYPRCILAMINDSRDTNTQNCKIDIINSKAYIYTIKNIESNQELYMSYGNHYWTYR